jgi:lysine 2,3-aminomutase
MATVRHPIHVREEEPPSLFTHQDPLSIASGSLTLPHLDSHAHRKFEEGFFWRKIKAYQELSADDFLSYRFQLKHTLSTSSPIATKKLLSFIVEQTGETFAQDVFQGLKQAPMTVQITPYILARIDWEHPYTCPIRTQFLPIGSRISRDHPMLTLDSLGEKSDSPVPGLVHRYYDRVLFLPQATCPVYCRFCTRSYAIGQDTENVTKYKLEATPSAWKKAFEYIESHPTIEDVVLSGGDFYNVAPPHIQYIGDSLLKIPHIKRIRIATKGLAVNPSRILHDPAWTQAIIHVSTQARSKFKQVFVHTHINCPEEITWVTRDALQILTENGVIVRNQSVLLRGVNDTLERMSLLVKRLGSISIQPYYVYQHDLVQGVDDLRTSLATTLQLEKQLRGITAGFNTPTFVVDAPGGGGKRVAWSYDYYDRSTGISIYSAPSVKPGKHFFYFDPLHALSSEMKERWLEPAEQTQMYNQAIEQLYASIR